jgi:tetratricopeptide (TPR) repeat protein
LASIAIVAAVLLTGGVDRNARRLNKEGNHNFSDGDFPAASQQYMDAQARAPLAPEIAYNLGNALYRQGNFAAAAEQLRRAAAGGVAVGSQSWYNLGNALFKSENLPEAAAYRALALAPGDREQDQPKTCKPRDQQQQLQDHTVKQSSRRIKTGRRTTGRLKQQQNQQDQQQQGRGKEQQEDREEGEQQQEQLQELA